MMHVMRSHAWTIAALGVLACSGEGPETPTSTAPPFAETAPLSPTSHTTAPAQPTPTASTPAGTNETTSPGGLAPTPPGAGTAPPATPTQMMPPAVQPPVTQPPVMQMPVPTGPVAVDPGTAGDGNITITTFTTQPELTNRGAPMGRTFSFTMDSTRSVIFDGRDATLQASKPRLLTRNIVVYVPARYQDGTPAPLLVMQDGPGAGQRNGQFDAVSRALDNLTISDDPARKLPAFIAIAVQNGGNDSFGSERGLEYDTLSDRYARFIELEVLPAVLADTQIRAALPGLRFTSDPEGRATLGCSSGGAAAFTMAWFRPDLFRRAITYSGTFVAQQTMGQPESAQLPLGAWEYHSSTNLIGNSERKPVRTFLNVNGRDNGFDAPESGYHNWVLANQHMATALAAKGYHYRFVTAEGIGHCDARAWQTTLADTLVWAWAGYPTE